MATAKAMHNQPVLDASLLGLPIELQDEIFSLIIPTKTIIHLRDKDGSKAWEPALMRVNHILRSTLFAYYTTNIFQADDYEPGLLFLQSLAPDAMRRLNILRIPGRQRHQNGNNLFWESQTRSWLGQEWKKGNWTQKGLRPDSVQIGIPYSGLFYDAQRRTDWLTLPTFDYLVSPDVRAARWQEDQYGDQWNLANMIERLLGDKRDGLFVELEAADAVP